MTRLTLEYELEDVIGRSEVLKRLMMLRDIIKYIEETHSISPSRVEMTQ